MCLKAKRGAAEEAGTTEEATVGTTAKTQGRAREAAHYGVGAAHSPRYFLLTWGLQLVQ